MFFDWCQKEGVIMPKLEYPAYFENGIIGTKCKEDIENREAYLFVPFKMMLTIRKVCYHQILGPIIVGHPECFKDYEDEKTGN